MDNLLQMFRDALLISEPIYKTNELVWNKWNAYFKDVENNNNKVLTSTHASPSFTALVSWLEKKARVRNYISTNICEKLILIKKKYIKKLNYL